MARRHHNTRIPLRGGPSFRRQGGQRPVRQLALLVCEDEKSVPDYLHALCVHLHINTAAVRNPPNTRGSAPISVVRFAAEKYQLDGGYDHTFCIFDKDEHESYNRALREIEIFASRANNPIPMRAITSVPCFEFWLLLHFEPVTRPMRLCADVIARLQRHIPGYVKGANDIFDVLLPRTDTAIRNARLVRRQQAASRAENPLTNFDQLIEQLRLLADAA